MSISFRRKGRTGNNLYQYFVTRILADIYKLNSSNEFRSPVLHFTDHTRYDTIINTETLVVTDDNIYDVIENHDKYRNRNFLLEGFFQDSGFFNDNYHNILSYLKKISLGIIILNSQMIMFLIPLKIMKKKPCWLNLEGKPFMKIFQKINLLMILE